LEAKVHSGLKRSRRRRRKRRRIKEEVLSTQALHIHLALLL
jgi:hypothetical protein